MSKLEDELKASKILIAEYKDELKAVKAEVAYYKAMLEIEKASKSTGISGWLSRLVK